MRYPKPKEANKDTDLMPAAQPHGCPIRRLGLGTGHYSQGLVVSTLRTKLADHAFLLASIPTVPDLQVAWLLLPLCAAPRSDYLLRVLRG